jgi:hypothetical protein
MGQKSFEFFHKSRVKFKSTFYIRWLFGSVHTYGLFFKFKFTYTSARFFMMQYTKSPHNYQIAITFCRTLWNISNGLKIYPHYPFQNIASGNSGLIDSDSANPFSAREKPSKPRQEILTTFRSRFLNCSACPKTVAWKALTTHRSLTDLAYLGTKANEAHP